MNTYLVPTTAAYCYEPHDYIYLVHANSSREVYEKATSNLYGQYITQQLSEYEFYPFELNFINNTDIYPFHISRKNVILKEIFQKEGKEYVELKNLYDYMYWGDYNLQIQSLADKAIKESWNFEKLSFKYV